MSKVIVAQDVLDWEQQEIVDYHRQWGNLESTNGTLSKNNGGFFSYKYCKSTLWENCLGLAIACADSPCLYSYFPKSYVSEEKLIKWCDFIKKHYSLSVRYLGPVPLQDVKFYGFYHSSKRESHLIACDKEPFYDQTYFSTQPYGDVYNYAPLLKISLLRYLYRPGHYEGIIEPIYDMVSKGIDPWHALQFAHYYFATKKTRYGDSFEPERMISNNLYGRYSLIYPTCYDHIGEYIGKFGSKLHSAWSSQVFSLVHGLNILTPEFRAALYLNKAGLRTTQYFPSPSAIPEDDMKELLSKEDWHGLYENQKYWLNKILPYYEDILNYYEYAISIGSPDSTRKLIQISGPSPDKIVPDKEYLSYVIKFIKSL